MLVWRTLTLQGVGFNTAEIKLVADADLTLLELSRSCPKVSQYVDSIRRSSFLLLRWASQNPLTRQCYGPPFRGIGRADFSELMNYKF